MNSSHSFIITIWDVEYRQVKSGATKYVVYYVQVQLCIYKNVVPMNVCIMSVPITLAVQVSVWQSRYVEEYIDGIQGTGGGGRLSVDDGLGPEEYIDKLELRPRVEGGVREGDGLESAERRD